MFHLIALLEYMTALLEYTNLFVLAVCTRCIPGGLLYLQSGYAKYTGARALPSSLSEPHPCSYMSK